jgi:predicted dehydrogenase
MGKRRIRNLIANGVTNISGFDIRNDRTQEANDLYQISVFETFEQALVKNDYDGWIISVPPDVHHVYMKQALAHHLPAFVEASVVDTDVVEMIKKAEEQQVLLAPSCTLFFHPAIKKIFELINTKSLGKLSNFLYHSGQYLPDWHTYEHVRDYYVSNKATGGGREIVPYELTWITMLLGFPHRLTCLYKKTIDIEGAETIDDTYNLLLDYKDFMFNLCVDVVSRFATRRLIINGSEKQLYWDWNENNIRLYDPRMQQWEVINYEMADAHSGYNKNITETMYNEEIGTFLQSVIQGSTFPNSIQRDLKILKMLYAAEQASESGTTQIIA